MPQEQLSPLISVIGLGKLGSPMAACFAAKGFTTVGVDLDPAKVEALNAGRAPVFEPQLQEMIDRGRANLRATQSIEEAVLASDITFVIVPTPSDADGRFSLKASIAAFDAIGKAIAKKISYHLVVMTSTVMPGATGGELLPVLQSASGKQVGGAELGLCYSPEFIALGSVIYNFLNPDFILIGESDAKAGALLEQVYQQVCDNQHPTARMNFVNAELTKLSVNTFVTTKITFANMLARICENLPDADVNVVTHALGLDTRIGSKYLRGAISYGGPCFPRDNKALARLAADVNAPAVLAEATDRFNREDVARLAERTRRNLSPGQSVGVLGLSYKTDTNVVEESPGVLLTQLLIESGTPVTVYDPAANETARLVLGDHVRYAATVAECIAASDVLVITQPWKEFKALTPGDVARSSNPRVILDCWRILDPQAFAPVADLVLVGQYQAARESALGD